MANSRGNHNGTGNLNPEGLLGKIQSARWVDLTHPFTEGMPYWPGRLQEPFAHTVEEVRPRVWGGCFTMAEHMGTHIDAPRHFVETGRSASELKLEEMISLGVLIDCSDRAERSPDYSLTVDDVLDWEQRHGQIPVQGTVLLHSGWASRWRDAEAYLNRDDQGVLHFPGFSGEAVRFLVESRSVRALGLDTLSADNMVQTLEQDSPVHRTVHESDGRILENLAGLDQLPAKDFVLLVASIPIEGATGAPARVVAFVP